MTAIAVDGLPSTVRAAIASGAAHYFTGRPCKNGHTVPRYVRNSLCLECARVRAVAKREYDIQHRPAYAKRKRQLRKERWAEVERVAIGRRRSIRSEWSKLVLPRIRHRAKQRGLEFSITAEDIPLPDVCPVFGIPLIISSGRDAFAKPNSPSVDRWDNSKGYVPGNVVVISTRANLLKKDATVEEMRLLLAYMERAVSSQQ